LQSRSAGRLVDDRLQPLALRVFLLRAHDEKRGELLVTRRLGAEERPRRLVRVEASDRARAVLTRSNE
jgi:hypothetical protein